MHPPSPAPLSRFSWGFLFVMAFLPEYMRQLEAKFGGSRAAWFLAVAFLISALLFLIGGNALIANIVGFLYPAFASFKVRAYP